MLKTNRPSEWQQKLPKLPTLSDREVGVHRQNSKASSFAEVLMRGRHHLDTLGSDRYAAPALNIVAANTLQVGMLLWLNLFGLGLFMFI